MSLLFMNRVALGVDCDDCTPQTRKYPPFRIFSNEITSKHYKTTPVDGFDTYHCGRSQIILKIAGSLAMVDCVPNRDESFIGQRRLKTSVWKIPFCDGAGCLSQCKGDSKLSKLMEICDDGFRVAKLV